MENANRNCIYQLQYLSYMLYMCIIQGCECILSQTFILPYIYHKKSAEEEKLEKIETAVTELQGNMVDTGELLFLKIQS